MLHVSDIACWNVHTVHLCESCIWLTTHAVVCYVYVSMCVCIWACVWTCIAKDKHWLLCYGMLVCESDAACVNAAWSCACVSARECKYQRGSSSSFPLQLPFILMFSRLVPIWLLLYIYPARDDPTHPTPHLTGLFLAPRSAEDALLLLLYVHARVRGDV